MDDEIVRSYRELLARGIPLDAIKQRAERDHVRDLLLFDLALLHH